MSSLHFPYVIHKMKTSIYTPVTTPPLGRSADAWTPGNNGYLILTISESGKWDAKRVDIKFPVLSVWVDPMNTSAMNTCKIHCLIPQKPGDSIAVTAKLDELEVIQAKEFATTLRQYTPHDYGLSQQALSVDEYTKILRHGVFDTDYHTYNNEINSNIPIYDNKSIALKNIIDFIVSQTNVKLSGVDLINLNVIPDSILEQIGFIKVPDRLGVGNSMWAGDPLRSLRPEMSSRKYYYGGAKESSDKMKETAEQFVKILEEELTREKAAA